MMGQCQCPQLAAKSSLVMTPRGVECSGDDAHGFLRVVTAVAETVSGG